jgi:aminopeptidase YwaD
MKRHSEDPLDHVVKLSSEIGPRPSGSPANQVSAAYIQSIFQDCGLEVEIQEYACPVWEDLGTALEVNGEALEAAANAYSPPCELTAPAVAISSIAELEAVELKGRIAVLYGDLTKAPLSPKGWFLKSERDDRVIQLLEGKEPEAIITIQAVMGPLVRVIEDWEFVVPSASAPPATGLRLLGEAETMVSLRIDSRRFQGSSSNVVGRASGRGASKVVLCAHYDTKFDTPGALDNASGVAALLSLARRLSQHDFEHDLELVAFSGEENLPIGDDEYLRRAGGSFGRIAAAINFDGIGHILGSNSLTTIAASEAFTQEVHRLSGDFPGIVWVDPWPQSNHSTFSWRGVPSIAFTTEGGPPAAHLRSDTAEWISRSKLEEVIALGERIVSALQSRSYEWMRLPKS